MNLILFAADELDRDRLLLRDRRAAHIREILGEKECFRVGEINGKIGRGRVVRIDKDVVELAVRLDSAAPPKAGIDLILALPRPIMLKRIIYQAAVLGVGHIYLIRSRRVEKSFFQASLLEESKLREVLLLGLEQAVDTRLPQVSVHQRFKPFVEDIVPNIEWENRLLAHPDTKKTFAQLAGQGLSGKGNRLVAAIGPEGGWIDYEVGKFQEQGFQVLNMGPRILRVDTAVVALLAQLHLFFSLSRNKQE